jgi:hypothetical protein
LRVTGCELGGAGYSILDCWIPAFAGMTGVINPIVIPAQAGIQWAKTLKQLKNRILVQY